MRIPPRIGQASLGALLLASAAFAVRADMIPMRDYIRLDRGMSEAEVLYRVGPFDHQSISSDYYQNVIRKIWYYIPDRQTSDSWITEIEFDNRGVIQSLKRYRARP